jgi:hypothetical protein
MNSRPVIFGTRGDGGRVGRKHRGVAQQRDELARVGRRDSVAQIGIGARARSNDDYLLALAERERAILVSADRHLLALADRFPVVSASTFLETLTEPSRSTAPSRCRSNTPWRRVDPPGTP